MTWIPLHTHSQYSILDSTISIDALVHKASSYCIDTLALTDFGNMYGAIDFYKACKKTDIKPIIGCEIMVAPSSRYEKKKVYGAPSGYPIVLLAKNHKGYQNLCQLSSKAFLEGFYYYPRIDASLLSEHSEGLICLSGPLHAKIPSLIVSGDEQLLCEEVSWFLDLFGEDYYFEIQRHKMEDAHVKEDGLDQEMWLYQKHLDSCKKQEEVISVLKQLSEKHGVKLVATNDIRYLEREDWKAHEILMNVQSGEPCEIWEKDAFGQPKARMLNPKRQVLHSHELFFKSPDEMAKLFADVPGAITNTVEIADKCSLELDFQKKYYPVFVPPSLEGKEYTSEDRLKAAEEYLVTLCNKGIETRYTKEALEKVREYYPDEDPLEVVKKRLKYELSVIIPKGMGDYLLIVHDFIAWAKSQGIPVGPGRGSGAGSIILYLIGITDIEPLRFQLLFERFINPERLSYPDIDVDICMERRSEVIAYTLNKYGKERVAQIITFGTMKAKMAIKDVGRVLNVPLAKVNAIAKLVPDDLNITLDKALEIDADFREMYETDDEAKRILEIARKVEGGIRNTGIHAAGLIICGDALTEHIPICTSKDADLAATQYAMKPVEMVGMLKIDFLGLKTLTSIQKAVEAIAQSTGKEIDWVNLPLNDEKTFNLLNQGKTSGVFQLESSGMQELAKQLHIDKFEEIMVVGALYRPGPMEMIPSFIARKHGGEKIEIDHEWMGDILKETYGIIVYQEQVIQIASKLANYSLGEGDVLRRAMGKKDRIEMAKQREKFLTGAKENGIDEAKAALIFDKVEKFASYGFNKSHAAAYGYLSYVTAYFKANYPKEWMAALMTCDMDDISKVSKHIRECQSANIRILSPDVNESDRVFVATNQGVRFALCAIKGVGEGVVESIVLERKRGGSFESLYEFVKRVDLSKAGKKVIENLIYAGCFDYTKWDRYALSVALENMFDTVLKQKKEQTKGILDLFSAQEDVLEDFSSLPKIERNMPKLERLKLEKELLGFYLTGHPLDEYANVIERAGCVGLQKLESFEHQSIVKAPFVIDTVQVRISHKSQKKFAILTISNGIERYELPIWPELYEQKGELLEENKILLGLLQIENQSGVFRLQCKAIEELSMVDEAVLEEMDQIEQRIVEQTRKRYRRNGKEGQTKKEKTMKEETNEKTLILHLDLEQTTMGGVLKLKQLFVDHCGPSHVKVEFQRKGVGVAQLAIDSLFGVKISGELEEKAKDFSFVSSLLIDE